MFQKITHLTLEQLNIFEISSGFFKSFPKLRSVSLKHNKLSNISSQTFNLSSSKVFELNLANNTIKTISPSSFSLLSRLKRLNLSFNLIDILEPGIFTGLKHLKTLDLRHNRLKNLSMTNFVHVKKLRTLILTSNKISWIQYQTEEIYAEAMTLKQSGPPLEKLKLIDLRFNALEHVNLTVFSLLPSLKTLDLSYNAISSLQSEKNVSKQNQELRNASNSGFNRKRKPRLNLIMANNNLTTLDSKVFR